MIGARPTRQARGATLLDAIIVLAALLLLCGGVLPIVTCRSRETGNRMKCASQLKQIAEAIGNYARDNGGAYPRRRGIVPAPPPRATPARPRRTRSRRPLRRTT